MVFACSIWVETDVELVVPAEFKAGFAHSVVADLCSWETFGEVGGVGGDFVGDDASRITSNINLEEIKRIAIGELGMTYATEGQVIPYESNSNDYMRQADNSQN